MPNHDPELMQTSLQQLAEDPEALELAYGQAVKAGEQAAFAEAVETTYAAAPDNLLLAAWHYRLIHAAAAVRVSDIRTRLPSDLLRGTLLFLNGIALGGLITALLIRNWVLRHCCTDGRWNPAYWDLADDLLPYYVVFGIASLLLVSALLIAWFIERLRSRPQSRSGR